MCKYKVWNWPNQGSNLKKIEVSLLIKGQNAQIQNQWSKWKRQPTSELTIGFGKDAIDLIIKIKISIAYLIE